MVKYTFVIVIVISKLFTIMRSRGISDAHTPQLSIQDVCLGTYLSTYKYQLTVLMVSYGFFSMYCMQLQNLCRSVTRQTCLVTRQTCMVTRQMCMVTRQTCTVTRQTCMVTRLMCMVTKQTCMVSRHTCMVTR